MLEKPIIADDILRQIASCLQIDDPAKIEHLVGRTQRYASGYLAARRGLRIRLSPGAPRPFLLSVAGHIQALETDLSKLAEIDEVQMGYQTARASEAAGVQPSLLEIGNQLRALHQVTLDIINAPRSAVGQKALTILDHAVGSFMALFEALTGERAGREPHEDGGAQVGRAGLALRKIFEALDSEISDEQLATAITRLNVQFRGRDLRERDFDWVSAIEDDGGFNLNLARGINSEASAPPS